MFLNFEQVDDSISRILTNILTHFSLLILTPFWGCKSCSAHEGEVHPHEISINIHCSCPRESHENEGEY